MTTITEESVAAGVQSVIAAYAHALDEGRVAELVELFWPDGVAEITGVGTFEGHDAISEGFAAFVPAQPQLHLVANTVVTTWTEYEATAVSNLAFLQRGDAGWAVQLVGRYDDTLHRRKNQWRFQRRVTTFLQ